MERFKNGNVLPGFLIGALGIALLLFGFIGIRTNHMIKLSCDEKISAPVLSVTQESKSVNYVEAEFYLNNTRYTAIAKHHLSRAERSEPRFKEGMQVTVCYSSLDPDMNYIEGAKQEDGSTVFVIGGILFLIGVIMAPGAFLRKKKKKGI